MRAYDGPGQVRATVAKRDDVAEDDHVRILLDTFNDQRRAYVLMFNPLGVQQDGILTEGGGEDYSVDIVMESKGVVADGGYTVEVAVPFKSLRYEAGEGRFWGLHAFRRIKRLDNELDSWMPISRGNSGLLNQAGRITGLEGISTGRTLEVIPSLTVSEAGERVRPPAQAGGAETYRLVNRPVGFDPGLTVKYGLTPTVTLDFAVNPDFAQVEADQNVITANQRFPVFFEERRPFFLEGVDIFQTPLTAVHTRAIIDPDVAAKLTGKLGRNSFGVLLASDNAPGNFSREEREILLEDPAALGDGERAEQERVRRSADKNALVGVLRFKRDVGRESNLGFIVTSYNFVEKRNHLAGLDGRFRLGPQTVFSFQVLGTTSRQLFFDPERGKDVYRTGNAFGYNWSYDRSGRNFIYILSGEGRTRDYRSHVGFLRRTDTNSESLFLRYQSTPRPKAKLISWRVTNVATAAFDWRGRMQNWSGEFQSRFNFRHQTYINVGTTAGYERVFEEEFGQMRTPKRAGAFIGPDPERSARQRDVFAYGGTTPSKKYSAYFFVAYGWNSLDFDFGAGPRFPRVSPAALADPAAALDPGPGRQMNLNLSFSYQPTDALRASLDYTRSRLVRNDTGRVAYDQNILAWRTTYQFTRFTFARARVDYDTLAANVRRQFLLGWTPNPGTAFYVGYNDDLNFRGYSPFTGESEPGFRRNGRTFFIKTSYLLRRGS